jgi:hypothetical protein
MRESHTAPGWARAILVWRKVVGVVRRGVPLTQARERRRDRPGESSGTVWREPDVTKRLVRFAAIVGALTLAPGQSGAQGAVVGASSMPLRVRWQADPPEGGLQAVCGRVFNDRLVDAAHVRLRVEGLNDRGEVTGRRDTEIVGQVAPESSALYCVTMFTGAATYRVTVINIDWMAGPSGP